MRDLVRINAITVDAVAIVVIVIVIVFIVVLAECTCGRNGARTRRPAVKTRRDDIFTLLVEPDKKRPTGG